MISTAVLVQPFTQQENQAGAAYWSICSGMDIDWDRGPSEVASTDAAAASGPSISDMDDELWKCVAPTEVVPTEFGE